MNKKANFASRIKELREQKGITQRKLAKDLGVSQGTINLWETGAGETTFAMLIKIAEYFNESVDYLLGRTDI